MARPNKDARSVSRTYALRSWRRLGRPQQKPKTGVTARTFRPSAEPDSPGNVSGLAVLTLIGASVLFFGRLRRVDLALIGMAAAGLALALFCVHQVGL
jgi:hypothetical protein